MTEDAILRASEVRACYGRWPLALMWPVAVVSVLVSPELSPPPAAARPAGLVPGVAGERRGDVVSLNLAPVPAARGGWPSSTFGQYDQSTRMPGFNSAAS